MALEQHVCESCEEPIVLCCSSTAPAGTRACGIDSRGDIVGCLESITGTRLRGIEGSNTRHLTCVIALNSNHITIGQDLLDDAHMCRITVRIIINNGVSRLRNIT